MMIFCYSSLTSSVISFVDIRGYGKKWVVINGYRGRGYGLSMSMTLDNLVIDFVNIGNHLIEGDMGEDWE